jgi:hypothetical protein
MRPIGGMGGVGSPFPAGRIGFWLGMACDDYAVEGGNFRQSGLPIANPGPALRTSNQEGLLNPRSENPDLGHPS